MKKQNSTKTGGGKIAERLRSLFKNRYGTDALSVAMMGVVIVLLLINIPLQNVLLSLVGMVITALVIFRMGSRNIEKRLAENRKYLVRVQGIKVKIKQWRARFISRKQFKYTRCPKCRAMLRLPLGAGQVSARCRACEHVFTCRV